MRFIENGPEIPDELLVARDDGDVLFFCGAGVSLAFAGLSDFLDLAGGVIDDLGSLTGSQARRLYDAARTKLPSGARPFVPADRMFSSLDLEFEPQEVRDTVARALSPRENVDLVAHRALIDLSRGLDGRPRLVTTNFDRLFEACDPALRSWGPANLPVPERPSDFEGIIHIHGRVDQGYTGMSETVVLSSAEFGKAYLSDGWATQYIRRLMSRFKLVFVGYSADDPPVQYLLEALRAEQFSLANLYAFQFGDESRATEQWLQKGVLPIAFGDDYAALWETLMAWAERAADPDGWCRRTLQEAASGPARASPVFRGRIAHLASTAAGVNKINSAEPPLPSTWLYVFDPHVRYMDPQRIDHWDPNSGSLDPFEHFGLDRDEPPPPVDPDDHFENREVPPQAWSAFLPNPRELRSVTEKDVGSVFGPPQLPPRVGSLATYLARRMEDTPTLWWAAGQRSMHPHLVQWFELELRYRLRDSDSKALSYWRHLLSAWKLPDGDPGQVALEIRRRAAGGWSPALVKEAVDLFMPKIKVERSFGVAPPMSAGADPAGFVRLDVEYPDPHVDFEFDAASLPLAISRWRNLLVEAERMETETRGWIIFDTTRPDDGERLGTGGYGLTGSLVRFTHLVEALEAANPEAAAKEARSWDTYDGAISERLRIWAAGRPGLTTIADAERLFAALDDEAFWSYRHERDLLFAIRDRWNQMSERGKRSVETRLLATPVPYLADLAPKENEERTAIHRLNALHWLAGQGVAFGFDLDAERSRLLAIAPLWEERFADHTAKPRVGKVFSITTDTDPAGILGVPTSQLLPIDLPETNFHGFREHDPFEGYSTVRPASAVLALHSAMRRGVDTAWHYWSTFLRTTAKTRTSARMDTVVVHLIQSIPPNEIAKLWYPLVDWLAERAPRLEARGRGEFDIVWNKVVDAAALHPSGYKSKPGRDWSFESLNAITGRLVLALLEMQLPEGERAVPAKWIFRFEKALALQGDHGRHALHLLARQVSWLHFHQPAWTEAHILGKASGGGADADAFWSGFARMPSMPAPHLIGMLKSSLLARVGQGGTEGRNLVAFILSGWGAEGSERNVSDSELRDLLVLGGDEVRRAALGFISDWAAEHERWCSLALPFARQVWPRQRVLKTPQMTSALICFASAVPAQFAEIIRSLSDRLVPLSRGHGLHLQCDLTDLDEAGVSALLDVLEKVLPAERRDWPYDGERMISTLVSTGISVGPRLEELSRRAAQRDH